MSDPVDVLIVGAGLAGLMAARTLTRRGKSVRLLERSRHLGGRLATRSREGATFDTGAQFFTTRDPALMALLKPHTVRTWCRGFPTPTQAHVDDGHDRYTMFEGMCALAYWLNDNFDILTGTKVTAVKRDAGLWHVHTEAGETHAARALLLTPPVPQSLALVKASNLALPTDVHDALAALTFDPCLALLIQLAGESGLPEPGAIRPAGEPLHIVVDNYLKGVSRRPGAITIHAGPVFSREFYNAPDAEVIAPLLEAAAPWLTTPRERVEVVRWRYSHPVRVHPERCVGVEELRLCFAGDAFGGPRVEGAVLSGIAAGEWLGTL